MDIHDNFRIARSYNLTVGSGAVVSATSTFGTQTRFVMLAVTDLGANSVAGCWYRTDTSSFTSATGAYLPGGWVQTIKVSPGEKVSAITNVATTTLNIMELDD